MLTRIDDFFAKYSSLSPLFIRLIIGWHLIYGTQDNVFSWERMLEFRDFLALHGLPLPLIGAVISAYAQFICGICYILGFSTRLAALIMIFNFIVALVLVHTADSYPAVFPALMMLFGSLFLLFNGAGRFSIDDKLKSHRTSHATGGKMVAKG